ncbi:MAG: HAD family phosphatase [Lachnospiraceae bacterium]|nr:HAD family phosphatase [Lachnospiraceae bacterium]
MEKYMNLKAIIFDMDGVILDSETISDKTWAIAQDEMEVSTDKDYINMCRGTNRKDTLKILGDVFGPDFDSEAFLNRTTELFYMYEESQGIPLMPYAAQILSYLKPKYRLALASSTNGRAVERQLTNAGVIDFFETRTTGEMVEHSKPDPEIYLMACEKIGVDPQNAFAIEDSYNGIRSAQAGGLRAIMVPDLLPADDEMKELAEVILPNLNDVIRYIETGM